MSPELIENVRSSHESLEAVLRPAAQTDEGQGKQKRAGALNHKEPKAVDEIDNLRPGKVCFWESPQGEANSHKPKVLSESARTERNRAPHRLS